MPLTLALEQNLVSNLSHFQVVENRVLVVCSQKLGRVVHQNEAARLRLVFLVFRLHFFVLGPLLGIRLANEVTFNCPSAKFTILIRVILSTELMNFIKFLR